MNPVLTVFLGIYNGSQYLDSLMSQLKNQSSKEFKLVVVDNCSDDSSWQEIQNWEKEFGESIVIHRNLQNLGAGGSLDNALKTGLIETPWFAMMHQDDFYLPNHVETLIEEIQGANQNTVGICTAMGSMNNDGSPKPTPPRASWLINDSSRANSFLVNVRLQAFSFPTAAVKTQTFIESYAHWHSPSFSDTETTLNLLTRGELKYVKKETIKYRENPNSESHVINSFESTVGASLGLTRVFTSAGFRNLLQNLKLEDRGKFFLELISGIENRVPESSMAYYLKILVSEECSYAWNYSELESNNFLSSAYASLGSKFTSSFLAGRSSLSVPVGDQALEASLRIFSNQLGAATFGHSTIKNRNRYLIGLLSGFPLPIKMFLFKIYVRVRSIKQPDYYWNIFWK